MLSLKPAFRLDVDLAPPLEIHQTMFIGDLLAPTRPDKVSIEIDEVL